MRIGILALQGAFFEHKAMLEELGVQCFEIRQKRDLKEGFDGLVLPGGESTTMGKLLKELDLFQDLKELIQGGTPVLATCAGLILLAEKIEEQETIYFQTLPVTVKRNAYGRQLGSFNTIKEVKYMGNIPMTFIRGPYISQVSEGVEILAEVEGNIVAVKHKNQLAMAFHPELTSDYTIHKYFLEMVKGIS